MPAGVMTKFRIGELSGVDRPAQEGAVAVIMKARGVDMDWDPVMKRNFSDSKRKELADSGKALPDGSFPIENEGDLHNAITAVGRAKDEGKAKAHIISRAHAMGMAGALPSDWVSKGVTNMDGALIRKALGLPETATDAEVIAKASAAEEEKKKAETDKAKAEKALVKASMTDDEKDHCDGMSDDDQDAFMAKPKSERLKAMAKAREDDEVLQLDGQSIKKSKVDAGVFAILKSQSEQLKANQAAIAKANEIAANATFMKRAQDELPNTTGTLEERAGMLKAIEAIPDEKVRKSTLAALHAADKIAKSAFSRIGTGNPGNPEGGGDDLTAKAKEIQKANSGMTFEKAYEKACIENPALYEAARTGSFRPVGGPQQ